MRIKQLILHAFGQFREKRLEIGDKPENGSDFHIFYGANEAGKTTIMEAWLRFLFGILPREKYDFLHKRQDLKISAVLQMQDRELSLTRIPRGHGSVLLDAQNQLVSQQLLFSAMGEIGSADEYRNMLCLDDAGLEQGGEAIIQSRGRLGELLFSAGSGLSGFSQLLEEQVAKTDAIYKSRGRSTELAVKLREYDEISAKLEAASLTPDNYARLKQRLRDSAEAEEKLKKQREEFYSRLAVLHDARRYYELEAKLRGKIAEQIGQMQKAAAELGVAAEETEPAAIYAELRPLAVNAAELQNLRNMQAEAADLARRISEQEKEIAPLEAKLRQAQDKCAALAGALPPAEQRQNLAAALQNAAADDLRQKYLMAENEEKRQAEQMRQALLDLSFKGQNFTAVPPSPLTEREAVAKLKQIEKLDAELAKQNEAAIAQEAALETAEAKLAALRNAQGQRIMPAPAAADLPVQGAEL